MPSTPDALFEAGKGFPSFAPTYLTAADDSDQDCGPEVVSDPVDTGDDLDTVVGALQQDLESCVPSSNCRKMGVVRCESSAPRKRLRIRIEGWKSGGRQHSGTGRDVGNRRR